MFTNFFQRHKSIPKNFQNKFSLVWYLAWGKVSQLNGAIWQDEQIAVFPDSLSTSALVISPSQRYVIVGDVWLSNLQSFQKLFNDNRLLQLSAQQLIAIAWEHWGIETLSQLSGIFNLAVWDREEQKLWLARDRTGARTLYYTTRGNTRWIAPNLHTLNPYHSQELDLVALRDYLCCAFVPGERTMWQDVRELRPCTVISFPDEKVRTYWQLPKEEDSNLTIADYAQQLRTLLKEIIQEYLPQNEPVGVFLSGGLDSSLVTALASKYHSSRVHTYSIHFGDKCPHELEFSSLVAAHCNTQHHILEITFSEMWSKLADTIACLDDPIGDPLTVPNLLIGSLAKESVNITLNGEGGDPCFGGPKNQPMLLNQLYGNPNQQDIVQLYLLSFQKCASDLPQLLQPDIYQTVCHQPSVFAEDLNSTASYLNRLMALNIKFKGADHILTKVNNLTNAVGLQGRSPLFDQRIVELSMQIPPEYKLSGNQEKAVLKQAVIDLLPERIIYRPKSGMMVPVQLGFRKYWQKEAKALLLNRQAAIAPYLNQSLIRHWLNYESDTWGRYGVKLWLLVSLEIWLQAFSIKS